VRAVLEGIALRTAELLSAMGRLVSLEGPVSIDGGLAANPYFQGFLARALGRPVAVPATVELTGFGTALLARWGAGGQGGAQSAGGSIVEVAEPLDPALHRRFADAVKRCRGWR
jgi:glycerol kinase